jgi:hypothetical protein
MIYFDGPICCAVKGTVGRLMWEAVEKSRERVSERWYIYCGSHRDPIKP